MQYQNTSEKFGILKGKPRIICPRFAQKSVFLFVQVVFFLKSVNSSALINKLLFAGKEWMAF